MSLIKEYFSLTKKYRDKYGDRTVVLMQVGAFFEVYGLFDPDKSEFNGSCIELFANVCELVKKNKQICVGKNNVYMSGFRDFMLEKYLRKLEEEGFTSVVYTQDVNGKNTTRSLQNIYSPGTYFSCEETNKISNNTTCVWLTKHRSSIMKTNDYMIYVGVSNIDIYTGKTFLYEYNTNNHHNPTTYDELERFISSYNPSEIIIIYEKFTEDEITDIIQFASIQSKLIHRVPISLYKQNDKVKSKKDKQELIQLAKNCEKQKFQNELLRRFYTYNSKEKFFETFSDYVIATQSFCFLLDFIYSHNPDLVKRIAEPLFENGSGRLLLANHTLKQLNIIDDQNYSGKLSSVMSFLNNCMTSMGKRSFNYQLLNPTTDVNFLNMEYDIVEYCRDNQIFVELRKHLTNIRDFEKNNRKVILKRITPMDLFILHNNLNDITKIHDIIASDKTVQKYIRYKMKISQDIEIPSEHISGLCNEFTNYMESKMYMEKCDGIDSLIFDEIIFRRGLFPSLDEKVENSFDSKEQLYTIKNYLNDIVAKYETVKRSANKATSKATEYIKIHETEKQGISLIATKRRIEIMKTKLPKSEITLTYTNEYSKCEKEFIFDPTTLTYTASTANNMAISNEVIRKCCGEMFSIKQTIRNELSVVYQNMIDDIYEKFHDKLETIIQFCTLLDVIQCKSYNASKYNYSKPTIAEETDGSFFSAKKLRHPLIEHLQKNELYVANDLELGTDEQKGVLLYGTNAVGKSSMIRSIGIVIVLAQSGMFVPCESLTFSPYHSIFTRILGNDNIFKSQSTFAVEMSELRTILQLANKNSLILGDELCSGTESDSAISIFVSGLMKLHEFNSSHIFATHFHEIVSMDEVQQLTRLKMKHMTVIYNKNTQLLEYDRKLKDGPGDNMYGLEVCKALHLPEDFLEMAHRIREKRSPLYKSTNDLNCSHFNNKKIMGICEMCKKRPAIDVHHLQHQKFADENGFIGTFHKNHLANLISLCKECHNDFHKTDKQYKKVSTSEGIKVQEI